MAKGAVGLVAGFWPEDVFRYLAPPRTSIDDVLLARQVRRRPDVSAVAAGGRALTFRELDEAATAIGAALLQIAPASPVRLALLISDPLEAVTTLFGAVRARVAVALLDPETGDADACRLVEGFSATLAVASEPRLAAALRTRLPHVEVLGSGELRGRQAPPPRRWPPAQLGSPAVGLVARIGGLVYHSHSSVVAAAVSWSTFLAVREGHVLATDRPLWTWEGLLTVTTALFRGGTALLADPGDATALASAVAASPEAVRLCHLDSVLAAEESGNRAALAWLGTGSGPRLASASGPVPPRASRRLASAVGGPLLPVVGFAETGPFLACHPSWYLADSVGIPITNVDLWPLNPRDGTPLRIPWEAVEFAEIGVKSPLTAVTYGTPERDAAQVRQEWHRTGLIATMDPNGMFYLTERA